MVICRFCICCLAMASLTSIIDDAIIDYQFLSSVSIIQLYHPTILTLIDSTVYQFASFVSIICVYHPCLSCIDSTIYPFYHLSITSSMSIIHVYHPCLSSMSIIHVYHPCLSFMSIIHVYHPSILS